MISKRVELFRIHREPPLGKLVIEVNGRLYRDRDAIDDAAVQGMLRAAAGDFVAFVGGYQSLVDDGMAPRLPGTRPSGPPRLAGAPLPPPGAPATEPVPPAAPSTLAEQIDVILQQLLAARPEFDGRTIRLRQGLKGGLQIEVDGRFFEQPGQITDSAVQQLLRRALQIWEAG